MGERQCVIYIVDDDDRVRQSVGELLASHDYRSVAFASAQAYLDAAKPDVPAILILDVELPDINGLELQNQIAEGEGPPIIFITGHGDVPSSVRAIKGGALDFLTKPFSDVELLTAIETGLHRDVQARELRAEIDALRSRYLALTPREREVLPLVVGGMLNKQAAARLGITEVTLQLHRRSVMRKMRATSFADLVRLAERLQVPVAPAHSDRTVQP